MLAINGPIKYNYDGRDVTVDEATSSQRKVIKVGKLNTFELHSVIECSQSIFRFIFECS